MTAVSNAIRSVLFNILFYSFTLIYCGLYLTPLCLAKTDGPVRNGILGFCKGCCWLARWVMGIKVEYRNIDLLPEEGAFILAAAHQSYMDPMLTFILRKDVTALAKRQLFSTPFIGTILKKARIVRIDREARNAHKGMDAVAEHVVALGRPLIVYPQATRVPVGQQRRLKSGTYYLHTDTGLPVYTVATNTGLFWTKGFFHRAGTAVFEIGPVMPEGLSKDEFLAYMEDAIVKRSDTLIAEAGYATLLAKPAA